MTFQNNQSNNFNSGNDIDLSLLLNIGLRNLKLISITSLIFFILACLISLSKKRVWEGQFDIVISTENRNISNPLDLISSTNFSSVFSSRKLKTEIGILESESVLMPAFDYMKNKKMQNNIRYSKKIRFYNWKNNNLKFKLNRNTNILNVSYRDNSRDLIIPVLEKISNLYQDYSGEKKRRISELSLNFLNKQINTYRKKSRNSFKEAQLYAIQKNLNDIDIFQNSNINPQSIRNFDTNSSLFQSRFSSGPEQLNFDINSPNVAIENNRISNVNKLRELNEQILKINEIADDPKKLQYIGSTIPVLVQESLTRELKIIEERLITLRSKYTEQDRTIQRTIEERKLLTQLLKKRAIGYLEAEKIIVESKIEALTRPKEVIIKYKELVRSAVRDDSILINLENQLRLKDLDKAILNDPWRLITKPIINDFPVAPIRKQYGLVGLIAGIFVGSLLAFIKEKRTNLVFEPIILERLFSTKIIEQIDLTPYVDNSQKIKFIINFLNVSLDETISILPLGDISNKNIQKIEEILFDPNQNKKKSKNFNIDFSFDNFFKLEKKFLLAKMSNLKFEDVNTISKNIKSLNIQIRGILLIKD